MDAVASKLIFRPQGRHESSGHRGIETKSVSHKLTRFPVCATPRAGNYVQDLVDPAAMATCRVAAIVEAV